MEYEIQGEEEELNSVLEWEGQGEGEWEGAGRGRLCLQEGWEEGLKGGKWYTFSVNGISVLFQTNTTISHSFLVSPSPPLPPSPPLSPSPNPSFSPSPSSCDPYLFDPSPFSLYGIQLYPSLTTPLPPSLRSVPLFLSAKGLSPCGEIGMSKDILAPFQVFWEFLSPFDEEFDINDWANGTRYHRIIIFIQKRYICSSIFSPPHPFQFPNKKKIIG